MESQAQVRLVYAGEVLEGHSRDEVRRMFGELFKLEGERLAAVFSGGRTVLKRSLRADEADRYLARLRKIGMKVLVEPMEAEPPKVEQQAATTTANAASAMPPLALAPIGASSPTPDIAAPRLVPLEDEVVCPNCGERQPKKFILCRKCTTDIPRALAAKQEDADRARAERLAARQAAKEGRGRFAPPRAEVGEVDEVFEGEVEPPKLLSLSFEGRLGRTSFFNASGVMILGVALLGILAAVVVPVMRWVALVPAMLGIVVGLVWLVRLNVLRLHDFNRSGWWVLLTLVPWVGQVVNLVLIFWPGHSGENDYGPKPRRGNTVVAAILTAVYLVAIVVALSFGSKQYDRYSERARQAEEAAERSPADSNGEQPAAPRLPGGPAAQAFRDDYMNAANEKAFALSSAGAYGWSSGKSSTREAMSAALSDCETRREAYTAQCRIVSVNGMSSRER